MSWKAFAGTVAFIVVFSIIIFPKLDVRDRRKKPKNYNEHWDSTDDEASIPDDPSAEDDSYYSDEDIIVEDSEISDEDDSEIKDPYDANIYDDGSFSSYIF